MLWAVLGLILVILVFVPQWWVRYVLNRHSQQLPGMPGNGGELARHLLDQYQLSHVKVEAAQPGADHYDPEANVVRLSPAYLSGKSLTAVAVAAHEVGHAIQFNREEPVSYLRRRHLKRAHRLQRVGAAILMILPVLGLLIRIPHLSLLCVAAGLLTLLASVVAYAAILPEEWDASFNKALPILKKGGYLPEAYFPAVRQVLKACALTYVAAALADVLSLWRWLWLLRYLR